MKKVRLNKFYNTKGKQKFALVDDCDFKEINSYNWCAVFKHNTWYSTRKGKDGKCVLMHRQILQVKDPKITVDHINFNGLDNRRLNIRLCSQSENAKNHRRLKKHTSKYLGVSWSELHKKWRAQTTFNYKKSYIGIYASEKEAAKSYDAKAKELFGEFANLNFKPKQKAA